MCDQRTFHLQFVILMTDPWHVKRCLIIIPSERHMIGSCIHAAALQSVHKLQVVHCYPQQSSQQTSISDVSSCWYRSWSVIKCCVFACDVHLPTRLLVVVVLQTLKQNKRLCIEPRTSALNATLPALRAPAAINRYLLHGAELSSSPAASIWTDCGATNGITSV